VVEQYLIYVLNIEKIMKFAVTTLYHKAAAECQSLNRIKEQMLALLSGECCNGDTVVQAHENFCFS
jgi:hypothetical protein